MFQGNVGEAKNTKDNIIINAKTIKNMFRENLKIQNIIIYIITFLISMVSIRNEVLPFGLSIIAACLGTEIPIAIVFLVSSLSVLIFQGANSFGVFLFTCIVYFLLAIIIKPKYALEERNEIVKTGGKLFWACFIVNLINNIRGTFLMYNLFMGTIISALTYAFYKIFVNGIVVIRDFNIKKAYSLEELVGAAIIIGLASTALSSINILGINLSNVIIILLILVLGWKNGMLLGGVSGISIGLAVSIVGNIQPIQIAAFSVAGIIAGFLNKFGKLGVIVGFILGNSILTYLYSGNIETLIYFREIFIASIGLLLVPNNISIDLEEIIGKDRMITDKGEYRLEGENNVKDKLNVVATAINEITKKYTCIEEQIDEQDNKEKYVKLLMSNVEDYSENIFYDEIHKNKDGIDDDMFYVLQQKENISVIDIIEILKIHNNYIGAKTEKIENDLKALSEVINKTYKMYNMELAKTEEKQKQQTKIVNELENVKNIITEVARETEKEDNTEFKKIEKEIGIVLLKKNIEIHAVRYREIKNGKCIIDLKLEYSDSLRQRDKIVNIADTISKIIGKKVVFQKDKKNTKNDIYIQTYSTEDKFSVQVGLAKITKEDSNFSGDSNLELKLDDGKYLLAISDGMGSGINARETSSTVLKFLKNFIVAGFEKEKTIELINSSLNLDVNEEMYASLDLAILDLYEGNFYSIKNGACTTYIKNKKNIKTLKSSEMPLGIVDKISSKEELVKLIDGDIIVLVSDGIIESKEFTKTDWLEEFLKNASTNNVQKLADMILAEAIDNNYGVVGDDMTVIVSKIVKKK
ncbi:MAG: SpoIIE family protein phosphatase [Clostridia bacterium]|nr:SpoIIE family protein phosphatase [Clostridia bacterium]